MKEKETQYSSTKSVTTDEVRKFWQKNPLSSNGISHELGSQGFFKEFNKQKLIAEINKNPIKSFSYLKRESHKVFKSFITLWSFNKLFSFRHYHITFTIIHANMNVHFTMLF